MAKEAPSSLHSKLEPPSEDVNEKLGSVSLEGSEGAAVMFVFGAVRSTVHVCDAGVASVLPAASVARTSKVCEPADRLVKLFGDVQEAKEPPSSLHSKLELPSLEVNEKLESVSLEASDGAAVMFVFGAVRSTLQEGEAGVASVLPAASVARTSKVCEPADRLVKLFGDVQEAKEPLSSLHSKLELPSLE